MRRMTGDFPSESAREAATTDRHLSAFVRSPCRLPGPHSTSALQRSRPQFAITDAQRGAPSLSPPVAPRQPTSHQHPRQRTGSSARDQTRNAGPGPEMLRARHTSRFRRPQGSFARQRGCVHLVCSWSVRRVQRDGPGALASGSTTARALRQPAENRVGLRAELEICIEQGSPRIYYMSSHRT